MHFIFGGRAMGKLDWAMGLAPGASVCDLGTSALDDAGGAVIINNVHLLVKALAAEGRDAVSYFQDHMGLLEEKIVIGDEVGSGVVPMEPFERLWRDETGRVYQLLTRHARRVTRLWAGIPQELKREGDR